MKGGSYPKCACTKIYVVDEVRQADLDSSNGSYPLKVSTFALYADELGIRSGNKHRTMTAAPYRAKLVLPSTPRV